MTEPPKPPSCGTCYFFRKQPTLDLSNETGECWRYPPASFLANNTFLCKPPSVKKDYCCGEFAAKVGKVYE